jgi:hypothetical protein
MKKIISLSAFLVSAILVLLNACEKPKEELKFKVYGKVIEVSLSGNRPIESCEVVVLNFPNNDTPSGQRTQTSSDGYYEIEGVHEGTRVIRFKPPGSDQTDISLLISKSNYELNFHINTDLGEDYLGGKVAYIYTPDDPEYIADEIHGLIIHPIVLGPAKWGCAGNVIGGTETVLGSGVSNTEIILDGCALPDIAARICDQLVSGGYNDWYLPSKDELDKLFRSKVEVGIYNNEYIWSSSEYNSNLASLQSFNIGYQFITNKDNKNYVVAIRKF